MIGSLIKGILILAQSFSNISSSLKKYQKVSAHTHSIMGIYSSLFTLPYPG